MMVNAHRYVPVSSTHWLLTMDLQIHYLEDGSVQIYSRNLEDNTAKYPDLVESMKSVRSPQ